MEIKHEIMSFNQDTLSIVVRYYTDEVPDGLSYNIDIPIENGQLASKEVIDSLIEAFKPVGQLERIAIANTITVPEFLLEKIPQVVATGVDLSQPTIFGADPLPGV